MKYLSFIFICTCTLTFAQRDIYKDPFRQLDQQLPTPNDYRNASGAPGHKYWQQQADYNIQLELNDDKQTISGQEVITYKCPRLRYQAWSILLMEDLNSSMSKTMSPEPT